MILNYPNNTDQILYLDEYLYNNNKTFENNEIDFKEYLNFENNIFGYVFLKTSIKNITGCGDYKFYLSTSEEVEIKEGDYLEGDEKMKIKYKGSETFFPLLSDCQIEYAFVATEPDLNNYDMYPESKEGDSDSLFFENHNYTGRSSYFNIKLTEELSPTCQDMNCDLCYKNPDDHCITCKNKFNILKNGENSFKQCFPPETDLITEHTTEELTEEKTKSLTEKITNISTEKEAFLTEKLTELIIQKSTITEKTIEMTEQNIEKLTSSISLKITELLTQKTSNLETIKKTEKFSEEKLIDIYECSKDDILLNKCKERLICEEQVKDIYKYINNTYLKGNYTGNNTLNNTIIQTKNVIFQISSVEDQKNSDNQDVSNIDLGICEERLRSHYKIDDADPLIIIKVDTKSEDLTQTYVQYQIYNPKDLSPLDLSICKDMQININIPVFLDNEASRLS